jgi:dUTP pyrophosphatase
MKLEIPFTVEDDELLPKRTHGGDAGLDLRSAEDVDLFEGQMVLVSTGVSLAIPAGWFGMVVPRSGLACKHGVTVINSPGIIDADYRGVLHVGLVNHGPEDFEIKRGDRIAQLLVLPVPDLDLMRVNKLDETERGAGGFGSTGVK